MGDKTWTEGFKIYVCICHVYYSCHHYSRHHTWFKQVQRNLKHWCIGNGCLLMWTILSIKWCGWPSSFREGSFGDVEWQSFRKWWFLFDCDEDGGQRASEIMEYIIFFPGVDGWFLLYAISFYSCNLNINLYIVPIIHNESTNNIIWKVFFRQAAI